MRLYVPGAAQRGATAKPNAVARCRRGNVKARAFAVPDQQCTAPNWVSMIPHVEGGALHCIRDTSHEFAKVVPITAWRARRLPRR
jgi:hypothetical protein